MTSHITPVRFFSIIFVLFIALSGRDVAAQTPKAVDLGLSVKWADCNLGATSPEQIGDPYAWGELTKKGDLRFTSDNYEWVKNGTITNWDTYMKHPFSDKLCDNANLRFRVGNIFARDIAPRYDVANSVYGKGWRLPTIDEWEELMRDCKLTWIKIDGDKCVKAVSKKNGATLYLPATGWYGSDDTFKRTNSKKSKYQDKSKGLYWSSTVKRDRSRSEKEDIYVASFSSTNGDFVLTGSAISYPWSGNFVRAVYDPSLLDDKDNNNDKKIDPNPGPKPKPEPKPDPSPVVNTNRPELTFIGWSESTHSPKITLKVGVKSKSAITVSTVTVNGEQTRGIKAVNNDGYDMMIRQEITLREGTNTVKVEVTNGAGTASKTAQVFYMPVVEDDKKEVTQQLRKVAYVVGNSNYPGNELPNPKNDATDISAKLRSLGFEVITLIDGTRRQIEEGITTFSRKAADADVAMFFYAGHGIQYNGANYLIPVDAALRSAKDIDYECTDVNRLLANMEESGCKMNIIALDACRNNPFERGWYRGSTSRGLSAINAPIGTFISYATSPGSVAADGMTRNSPYTSALLSVLNEKGLPIETVFKKVAEQVFETTDHRQTPWYSSSLFKGEFIFNPAK